MHGRSGPRGERTDIEGEPAVSSVTGPAGRTDFGRPDLADVERRVEAVAEPILQSLGLEFVCAEYLTEHGRRILRLYIDKPGGVTLDDCADVSRELGAALDVEDPISQRYIMEVSSPGLDRPLVKESDYVRFAGKKADIRTKEALEGRRNFKVTIDGAADGVVVVTDSEGRRWDLALANIDRARLEIEI